MEATDAISCWGTVPPSSDGEPQQTGRFVALSAQGVTFAALTDDGSMRTFALPVDKGYTMPLPGHWDEVAMGSQGSVCALSKGVVTCQGVTGDVPGMSFSHIAAGSGFACGIASSDGSVHCWGDAGEPYTSCISRVPQEGQLDAPSGTFVQISSSTAHTCAIATDHTIACWGAGKKDASPTVSKCGQRFNYGQSVAPAGTFVSVAAGQTTSCGIHTDGTLECWGAGTQSGACATDVSACGQALPPTGTFKAVAVGYTHACAIRTNGKVACWGSNTGGRATPPVDLR
jgi:alpha-tubulin suppressor-like RCC1 family protein